MPIIDVDVAAGTFVMEVARGETDGTVWRLEAQPVEGGVWLGHGICVSGSCRSRAVAFCADDPTGETRPQRASWARD